MVWELWMAMVVGVRGLFTDSGMDGGGVIGVEWDIAQPCRW